MTKDLSFPILMDTSEYNIKDTFFKPLLENMNVYYRGVGYFSSGWISQNAEGLVSFIESGGSIKWITSPILSEEDFETFLVGEDAKTDLILKSRLKKEIDDLEDALSHRTLITLAWLIADGIIDIKLAVPCNKLNGEFHDKFGYFQDLAGNCVSFNGSNNESKNGMLSNYESFTIFYSWHKDSEISKHANKNKTRFLRLWENEDENLKVYSIPESVKEKILKLRSGSPRPYSISNHIKSGPKIPQEYKNIREYQREAFKKWRAAQYSGIFAMATGTGKTVTSLYCALMEFEERYLLEEEPKYQIVILVPTKTLVNQWALDVQRFGFLSLILAYSDNHKWKSEVKKLIDDSVYLGYESNFVIIATYISFSSYFDSFFSKLSTSTLLIADEVHNLGSESSLAVIDKLLYKKKIGLSATPKRIYSPESSNHIEDFFGSSYPYTFSYSMQEAIQNDVLSKYDYRVKFCEFDTDEFQEYCRLTSQIGAGHYHNSDENGSRLTSSQKMKLIQRKRLMNSAASKGDALIEVFSELAMVKYPKYCLVYAPGGNDYFNSAQEQEYSERIIVQYQKIIHDNFPNLKQASYLGETKERELTIESFRSGSIDVLFAINCLDEGVDIPRTEIGIFTSSSGNPRQYIQRRGRLLRKHREKSKALIYDLITLPPTILETQNEKNIARNLVINELRRSRYFLELSEQKYLFHEIFDVVLHKYQIAQSDIQIDEEFL